MSTQCSSGSYYDPNTKACHPCSDCQPPRPHVGICVDQCKKSGSCPDDSYYDSNAQQCYPCSECRYPMTRNKFCSGCPERLSTASPMTSPSPSENNQQTVIISIAIVFVLALAVIVLGVYCCIKYLKRKYKDNKVIENGNSNANGAHVGNEELQLLNPGSQDTQQAAVVELLDPDLARGIHPPDGGSIPAEVSGRAGVSLPAGGYQPAGGTVPAGGSLPGRVYQPSEVWDHFPAKNRMPRDSEQSSLVQEGTDGQRRSMVFCTPSNSRQSSPDSQKLNRRVSFRTDSDHNSYSDIAGMSQPADEISAPSLVCPSQINNNHLPRS